MYKTPFALLKFVAKALLNAGGGGVLGELCIEVLPDLFNDIWDSWSSEKNEKERREELETLAHAAAAEIRQDVVAIVNSLASERSETDRQMLETILMQVPERVRQSLRRPSDPTGTTIPADLVLSKAEDLLPFLPDRMPRFKPGDRPLTGLDWELAELLGIGGFGEVWKARHTHMESRAPVALKFCLDAQARQRLLLHEAKVCDRVMRQGRHPGIVQLQETYLSADPPCLQYEYIEGGDLAGLIREWHRQPEKPTPDQVAKAILQISEIIAFTHRLEPPIVHRDIKPANILIQRAGGTTTFKIADFGIGGIATYQAIKATRQATSASQFMISAVRGSYTPSYASPEQMRGNPPDPRDDVHALGVIWYQMLTGDLAEGRPSGSGWRKRGIIKGMMPEMVDLLESCFEVQDERPADAFVLAQRLRMILTHVPKDPSQPRSSQGGGVAVALVPCPECGRHVSTRAAACPQCGCPLGSSEPASSQAAATGGHAAGGNDIERDWLGYTRSVLLDVAKWGNARSFLNAQVPHKVQSWKSAAERGDPQAQVLLAEAYSEGFGVREDPTEAVRWFRKAADQGNVAGQFRFGLMLASSRGVTGDEAKALELVRKAAERGYAPAQAFLGRMQRLGLLGLKENDTAAAVWLRKAAEQGEAESQDYLGELYRMGCGVPEDHKKAFAWTQKAAEQGLADGQFHLGEMYEYGIGVDEDESEAKLWYRKAAEQGHEKAQRELQNFKDDDDWE